MSSLPGWMLAAAALVAGWFAWGWQGLVLAVTLIVFWLLLQFNRSIRIVRRAGASPVGHVASAVMLHARLAPRMTMLQVITLTRSLGRRVSETPEVWAWTDPGGAGVRVTFADGRVVNWALDRAEGEGAAP